LCHTGDGAWKGLKYLFTGNRYQDTEEDDDIDGESDIDSIMEIIKVFSVLNQIISTI